MASKAEYLKKYLRPKGNARSASRRAPGSTGALRLRSDDEEDEREEVSKKGGRGTPGKKKTLFQVLRQAPDGSKYLFKDEDAEELPESDDEEVRVVGADGQTLALSEADKKKVAELIAKEEGRVAPEPRRRPSPSPVPPAAPLNDKWKAAFSLDGALPEAVPPAPAPSPYGARRVAEGRKSTDDDSSFSPKDFQSQKHQQESSSSSGRTHQAGHDEDLSPPRRGHDEDLSPPRRRHSRDTSSAGKGEQRADFSAASRTQEKDLSPPRKRRGTADVALSKREREEDLSPPRRGHDADMSHGEKGIVDKDSFSKRRQDRNEHEKDLSPPRRAQDKDLSPPRRPRSSGPEAERAPAGRRSNVVFRDREGRIISEEEWLTLEGAKGRKRPRERGPAPVLEWGSGLRQKEDLASKKREEAKVANQPFARYEIDEDYDADLRARDRWADPIAQAPKASSKEAEAAEPARQDEGRRHAPERPTCPHDAPPNRFGIKPGYRWDGVVRGNGFEEERIKAINRRKWEAEMAHMNNTADL